MDYTQYTQDNARLALPHLIYCAKRRKTITYGELADLIGKHHRAIPHALGYIRDEICITRNLPLINAIVVNTTTELPGESWLPQGTDHLIDNEYRKEFEKFRDRVFEYTGWDALLREMDLEPIKSEPADLNDIGRAYTGILARQGGGGEGDHHKNLKEYVARHPEAIGLPGDSKSQVEYDFISGDYADVVFELKDGAWAVAEIKNRQVGELVRGVYQVVKYRALLKAENGQGSHCMVDAVLVAYDIPLEISFFAAKFGIRCKIIKEIPE